MAIIGVIIIVVVFLVWPLGYLAYQLSDEGFGWYSVIAVIGASLYTIIILPRVLRILFGSRKGDASAELHEASADEREPK